MSCPVTPSNIWQNICSLAFGGSFTFQDKESALSKIEEAHKSHNNYKLSRLRVQFVKTRTRSHHFGWRSIRIELQIFLDGIQSPTIALVGFSSVSLVKNQRQKKLTLTVFLRNSRSGLTTGRASSFFGLPISSIPNSWSIPRWGDISFHSWIHPNRCGLVSNFNVLVQLHVKVDDTRSHLVNMFPPPLCLFLIFKWEGLCLKYSAKNFTQSWFSLSKYNQQSLWKESRLISWKPFKIFSSFCRS